MNLQTIIQIENSVRRLDSRLGCLLEPDMREGLERAATIMAEVRHFAVAWADSRELGSHEQAARVVAARQACIDRLVQTLRPE